MSFLDRVKQAAKEAWNEQQAREGLDEDQSSLDTENARIQKAGDRDVFSSHEDVRIAVVQGGGGRTTGDTVGKLLSAANEAANPTIDVEVDGEGLARSWPDGTNLLVVLTDRRLLVTRRREVLREDDIVGAWWVSDVADMSASESRSGGTLTVTFTDGSSVRAPIATGGFAEHVAEVWRTRPAKGRVGEGLDPFTYDRA